MKRLTQCVMFSAVALSLAGCAALTDPINWDGVKELSMKILDEQADKWIAKLEKLPPVEVTPPNTEAPATPGTPPAVSGDQVPFGDLVWWKDKAGYPGGFNGSAAVFDRVTISELSCNGQSVFYHWDTTLTPWGIEDKDIGAIVGIWFWKDGRWIGGKFDWVSAPDRSSREMKHCDSGAYSNWPAVGITLPWRGKVAFCVFSADGKRRSNVLVAEAKQ